MITKEGIRKAFGGWSKERQAPQGPELNTMVDRAVAGGPLKTRPIETEVMLRKTKDIRNKGENIQQFLCRLQIGYQQANTWTVEKLKARALLMQQNSKDEVKEPRPALPDGMFEKPAPVPQRIAIMIG